MCQHQIDDIVQRFIGNILQHEQTHVQVDPMTAERSLDKLFYLSLLLYI